MLLKLICSLFFLAICSAEKVIIIGAGAAGLATASRLLENNITDFRILEAEERIGGRINSIFFGDAFIDLGAQNIHGDEGNLVYEIAKEFVNFKSEISETHVYYQGCKKHGNDLIEDYYSLDDDISYGSIMNDTFGDIFLKRYESILEKFKNDKNMLTYAECFIRTAECIRIEDDGCFRWFQVVASPTYEVLPGSQTLSWDGLGYETILYILLNKFPQRTDFNIDNWISFNKTVTKINIEDNSVRILTQDGAEFRSDYVVFTPSLGVLKHNGHSLFEPSLSAQKMNAIETLGFDGGMKVIFHFSERWLVDGEKIYFVWSDEDKSAFKRDIHFGPRKDNDHWLSWFSNIAMAPNNPNVLIGWFVGPMVPEIEELTDEELEIGTLYAMRRVLGKTFNVPDPIKVIQ
ncbi:hypothetical protein WA026_022593 [Henosepilachna vigintioctopunctata]|uniref:Amine oxidase domain-containing protein n=1 Tax=Henosepilachna vigintioctopunctata TaxID=420089 RepID=A0AAW1V578_9CUCU